MQRRHYDRRSRTVNEWIGGRDDLEEGATDGGCIEREASPGALRGALMSGGSAIACFTFDNMAEASEIGAGTLTGPRSPGTDRALVEGQPRLLDLLDRHGVRASFFPEGWNGVHHPAAVREIVDRGHELGMHGWLHERWSELDPDRERTLAERATDALADAAGVRPIGFRAPGGARSARTESILRDLGYTYDASLGDGMRPGRLPGGLPQVPFVWPGVDGFFWLRDAPVPAVEVGRQWLAALEKTAARGGLFVLVCHAHVTGAEPERVAVLGEVMARAVADQRVEVRTLGEVAAALG
jgi:peptidoglycan/xylan/chitin deacetylase (PgdA/CDA1 family)